MESGTRCQDHFPAAIRLWIGGSEIGRFLTFFSFGPQSAFEGGEVINNMSTILIIILVLFLLGGGGWGYSRWRG
jgi:hypothetical protein